MRPLRPPVVAGLLALLLPLLLAVPAAAASQGAGSLSGPAARFSVVATADGPVRGTVSDRGRTFLGLPFASPPVGEGRWRPPGPVEPWTQVREATRYGGNCARRPEPALGDPGTTNEDCLYLNVFTPPGAATGRPVLVWFHGGAFVTGSAAAYDAARLARAGGLVVVTANYRLGSFGYLAHRALTAESPAAGSGDYGLMDQQAALRWVRDNAAAFGGAPGRVTLAGQSSGGLSGCAHLVAPRSRGLFSRAVIHSAPCVLASAFRPAPVAESDGADFAAAAGCGPATSVPSCLRGRSAAEVLAVPEPPATRPWSPVAGNPVLPESPAQAIPAGRYAKVPVLLGSDLDEGTIHAAVLEAGGTGLNALTYPLVLAALFKLHAPRVASRYPGAAYGYDYRLALAAVLGDYVVSCPTLRTAEWFGASVPTYAYEFADRQAPNLYALNPGFPLGAYHGAELPSLFDLRGPASLTPAQLRLAGTMTGYWSRFAATGNPNADPAPPWPSSRGPFRPLTLAPDTISPRPDFVPGHRCDFWASVPSP